MKKFFWLSLMLLVLTNVSVAADILWKKINTTTPCCDIVLYRLDSTEMRVSSIIVDDNQMIEFCPHDIYYFTILDTVLVNSKNFEYVQHQEALINAYQYPDSIFSWVHTDYIEENDWSHLFVYKKTDVLSGVVTYISDVKDFDEAVFFSNGHPKEEFNYMILLGVIAMILALFVYLLRIIPITKEAIDSKEPFTMPRSLAVLGWILSCVIMILGMIATMMLLIHATKLCALIVVIIATSVAIKLIVRKKNKDPLTMEEN